MKIDKEEISERADRLRKAYDIQTNGIKDIFSFINAQGIELIRYPFGKDTLLGFSTFYEGKKIIVANSSEILPREIYTIAHELGHIIYDFSDNRQQTLKIDKDDSNMNRDYSESVAYYFADCLLMPEDKLHESIKQGLKKKAEELSAINIIQMQLEYNVSFSALVKRLLDLDIISSAKKNSLYSERDFYSSKQLFRMLGADERLLNSTDKIIVPPQYSDFVVSNYENGFIPFSSLIKAFSLLGIDTTEMNEKNKKTR